MLSTLFQFWMVIFPEGTRYNPNLPDIIRKSQQYAQEQGSVMYINFVRFSISLQEFWDDKWKTAIAKHIFCP